MIQITLQTGFAQQKTSFLHVTTVIRIMIKTGFHSKASFVHVTAVFRITLQTGFSQQKTSFEHFMTVIRITPEKVKPFEPLKILQNRARNFAIF